MLSQRLEKIAGKNSSGTVLGKSSRATRSIRRLNCCTPWSQNKILAADTLTFRLAPVACLNRNISGTLEGGADGRRDARLGRTYRRPERTLSKSQPDCVNDVRREDVLTRRCRKQPQASRRRNSSSSGSLGGEVGFRGFSITSPSCQWPLYEKLSLLQIVLPLKGSLDHSEPCRGLRRP